jgi:hypothetical protein
MSEKPEIAFIRFWHFFSATCFAALGGGSWGQLAFPLVGLAELEGLGGGTGGGVVLPHQAHRPLHQAQPGHLHHTPSYTKTKVDGKAFVPPPLSRGLGVTAPLLRGVEADFVDIRRLPYFFHCQLIKKWLLMF